MLSKYTKCPEYLVLLSMVLFLSHFCHAFPEVGMTEAEIEWWFNEDDILPVQVDEGELVFLSEASEKPVLHSISELTIDQHGIKSGWISLSQCYKHLDPVARTSVVYQYPFMKNLRILSKKNIQSATIIKQSIELENVSADAQLCIAAEVKIFNRLAEGTYSLSNGPYHRKFLDGYFPYHVTLSIHYPESNLKIISTNPENQPGFQVKKRVNTITFDSIFAGQLKIEATFKQRK